MTLGCYQNGPTAATDVSDFCENTLSRAQKCLRAAAQNILAAVGAAALVHRANWYNAHLWPLNHKFGEMHTMQSGV